MALQKHSIKLTRYMDLGKELPELGIPFRECVCYIVCRMYPPDFVDIAGFEAISYLLHGLPQYIFIPLV